MLCRSSVFISTEVKSHTRTRIIAYYSVVVHLMSVRPPACDRASCLHQILHQINTDLKTSIIIYTTTMVLLSNDRLRSSEHTHTRCRPMQIYSAQHLASIPHGLVTYALCNAQPTHTRTHTWPPYAQHRTTHFCLIHSAAARRPHGSNQMLRSRGTERFNHITQHHTTTNTTHTHYKNEIMSYKQSHRRARLTHHRVRAACELST